MEKALANLFSGTISTLSRSLDLRSQKHQAILNNVANADTPNYKPFKINVEEAMQTRQQSQSESNLHRTDDQHLPGQQIIDDATANVESTIGNSLLLRGDQNGVDIDAEMTALAKNSLLYKASSQIVSLKFQGLKKAITGGSQ